MSGRDQRILSISIISSIILMGNVFVLSWSWGNNPIWVSSINTVVALSSVFAWLVAIVLITEDD